MARLNHVKSFRGTSKTKDGNLSCESCGDKIKPGDSYRWWANKAPGSRGSWKHIRCSKSECTPSLADRTPGRRGQLMQIQAEIDSSLAALASERPSVDDYQSAAQDAAGQLRSLAEEIQESADNMEQGFGHATYQSEELAERAQALESVCDELESLDFEDEPEVSDFDDEDELQQAIDLWRDECVGKISEKVWEADV